MEFMKSSPLANSFNRSEARHDAIGRAARDIIAQDATIRRRNTERLKAARLARDAALPPPSPEPVPEPKRRKKAAKS